MLEKVTAAQGGVLLSIQALLLPKKSAMRHEGEWEFITDLVLILMPNAEAEKSRDLPTILLKPVSAETSVAWSRRFKKRGWCNPGRIESSFIWTSDMFWV